MLVNATLSSMLTLIEELLKYEYEHVLLAVIIIFRFCIAPALIQFRSISDNEVTKAMFSHSPPLHQNLLLLPLPLLPGLLLQLAPHLHHHLVRHPLEPALLKCVTLAKLLGGSWSSDFIRRNQ